MNPLCFLVYFMCHLSFQQPAWSNMNFGYWRSAQTDFFLIFVVDLVAGLAPDV